MWPWQLCLDGLHLLTTPDRVGGSGWESGRRFVEAYWLDALFPLPFYLLHAWGRRLCTFLPPTNMEGFILQCAARKKGRDAGGLIDGARQEPHPCRAFPIC